MKLKHDCDDVLLSYDVKGDHFRKAREAGKDRRRSHVMGHMMRITKRSRACTQCLTHIVRAHNCLLVNIKQTNNRSDIRSCIEMSLIHYS